MHKILGHFVEGRAAFGLLLLRVFMGTAIMQHGYMKIHAPFNWMDKPGRASEIHGALQALAALGEFGGGLGIVLGILTPLSCLGVLCTMLGAWFIMFRGTPWIDVGVKSFELPSLYFIMAATLLFTGPGRFSIDALLWGRKKK